MNFIRSKAAFIVTLCLSLGMLFWAVVPVKAEESYSIDELFSLLTKSLDVSENTYKNYDSLSSDSLPIGYFKTENPGYLALGGDVAYGYGAQGAESGDFKNCYANKFADHLGYGSLYENRSSSLLFATDTVVEQVQNLTQYIKMPM